jgi:LysR family glycine cleavage system transcriptional activator
VKTRSKPRISLDLLRGFCVAARHLSFTRAAQELFLTQPAISREIRTLEDQLGQPLFRRANRTLQLTAAGHELFAATQEALNLIDAAVDRACSRGKTLSVTTTTSLASVWLAPRLADFVRAHPGLDIRLVAVNDMVNLNLERGRLDVAIRFVPPGWDIPQGERLVEYEIFPVCSPRLLKSTRNRLRTPADLANHVLLDFERLAYGGAWSDWDRWFKGVKLPRVQPSGTLHFSHYDQVIHAALEGNGIAIGKRPHLTRHLQEGLLCAPFGNRWVANPGAFYLVVDPAAGDEEPLAGFVQWLRTQLREGETRPTRRGRTGGGMHQPSGRSGRAS